MLKKTTIVFTVLLACLLAISAVSAQNPAAGTDNATITVESTDETVLGSSAMDDLENDNRPLSVDTDSGKLEMGEGEVLGDEINVTGDSFTDISEAIRDAKSGDIIYLQGEYYKGDGNQIIIDTDLTIIGGFKEGDGKYATLDAQQLSRIFEITSHVTLQGIIFINGSSDNGGALFVNGGCTLIDCIFTNNNATESGGAVYWNSSAIGINNCTFENNYALVYGGANHFEKAVTNVNLTGNFKGNQGWSGGANMFWDTLTNVNLTGNFTDNCAHTGGGGANYFRNTATNVALSGNFNSNFAKMDGGANVFSNAGNAATNITLTGNFINNYARSHGGANYFNSAATNVNLTGNFINNSAEDRNGGANYFYKEVTNVTLTSNFTNNHAGIEGGANYFNGAVTNVTLTGNFINNSAEEYGGANCFWNTVTNVNLTCNFTNNHADKDGGANYFRYIVTNVTLTGNFTNNSADNGGANYFNYPATNVNLTGDFINNFAKYNGGANRFWVEVTNVNIIGNFNNNRANVSGSANCFSNAVTNATLTGNYINNTGSSVIYISISVSGNVIRDSIFINNDPIEITHGNITAVDNWFGNNATNYNIKPDAGIDLDNWLFINGTASPNPVSVFDTSNIIFRLSRYDETGVSSYDNSRLIPITLSVTSTLGRVNKNQTKLNESLTYTPDSGGNGSITASFENVLCSVELEILKEEPDMSFESDYSYAGENATIFIYLQSDAGGNVTVTDADGNNRTEKVIDGTVEIVISNINAGVNKFNITYSGDDKYLSKTTEYEIEVEAMPTFLSVESFEMYQGDGTKYMVNLTDINGKPVAGMGIKVNITGKTYTIITDENGTAVLPINLKPAVHPATAFFNGKGNYANTTPVTTNVSVMTKVRIDKHKDMTKDYGDSDKFTVHAVDKFGKSVGAYAKVKMTICGKTYTVFTDENGYASLAINLKPGTYDITCEYANYTVKHKVTVKQVLSATNRQYKKASSYQFTATLKHSNGKPITGKTVTFTFKGKTYTQTTNAKGEATITIKEALNLGTYNIAIRYLDSTITKTITIK